MVFFGFFLVFFFGFECELMGNCGQLNSFGIVLFCVWVWAVCGFQSVEDLESLKSSENPSESFNFGRKSRRIFFENVLNLLPSLTNNS